MKKTEFGNRFNEAVLDAMFDLSKCRTHVEVVFGLGYQTGGECVGKLGELKGRMACRGKLCPLVCAVREKGGYELRFASVFTSFGETQWLDHKYLTRSRRRTHSCISRPIPAYVEDYFLADSAEQGWPHREKALAWLRAFYQVLAETLRKPEWREAARREVARIDQDAAIHASVQMRPALAA